MPPGRKPGGMGRAPRLTTVNYYHNIPQGGGSSFASTLSTLLLFGFLFFFAQLIIVSRLNPDAMINPKHHKSKYTAINNLETGGREYLIHKYEEEHAEKMRRYQQQHLAKEVSSERFEDNAPSERADPPEEIRNDQNSQETVHNNKGSNDNAGAPSDMNENGIPLKAGDDVIRANDDVIKGKDDVIEMKDKVADSKDVLEPRVDVNPQNDDVIVPKDDIEQKNDVKEPGEEDVRSKDEIIQPKNDVIERKDENVHPEDVHPEDEATELKVEQVGDSIGERDDTARRIDNVRQPLTHDEGL